MSPEEATIAQRARLQVTNTIVNLQYADRLSYAVPDREPQRGMTAYVVGAGPSLDRTGPWLEYAARTGMVLTVNTALGAVSKWTSDATCVAIENVDVTEHLHHQCTGVVAAVSSHPNVFARAIATGGSWFMEQSPHLLDLCRAIGVWPLAHGGSAVTNAVTLAHALGAARVVLVGCDLAFDGDRAYASGAGWDGLEVGVDGDAFRFDGREDRDEMHHRSGAPPVTRRPRVYEVPAWGGGTTRTKRDYLCQAEWLSEAPRRFGVECINATEGGMRIDGWRESRLRDVVELARSFHGASPFGGRRVSGEAALVEIAEQAGRCRSFLDGVEAGSPDFSPPVRGFPMVEAMAASDLIRLSREDMEYQARNRAVYEVLRAACDEVENLING